MLSGDANSQTAFTVHEYLAGIHLPVFRKSTTKFLTTARVMNALEWPVYPELQKAPSTRTLRHTVRTEVLSFVDHVGANLKKLPSVKIDPSDFDEAGCPLRLLSTGHVSYERDDINFFKNINNEEQYVVLMENYVLHTVSECLRMLYGEVPQSPAATSLKFQRVSHLCLAHHSRWDIMALPGTAERPHPFFVFFVSPSEFGTEDMMDLCDPRTFKNKNVNELDTPSTMVQTLWAVINDTCKGRGRFFAVSNYTCWAFGELNRSDTVCCITFPFEAPLIKTDGTASQPFPLGYNVIEMLAFWVTWAIEIQRQAGGA